MLSKNFYFQTIGRVIFIAATALLFAFLMVGNNYVYAILMLIVLVFQAYYLIRYVNETNRKIAYFFDAIKNEDFTLRFPEKLSVKSLEELNHSLNMLNEMIQRIHLKNQTQERFYQEILKQADIGILAINDKGHILFANPRLELMLNYTPLNHIKQLKQVDENLYEIFKNFKPFQRKLFQLSNEREQIQLALKSTPLSLDGQSLQLVVVQDIHKELDEKETESWVRLIRVLTHEIMNTITPIASISDSIIKYYRKGDKITPMEELEESQIKNTLKGLEVIKDQGGDLMDFVQSYRSLLHVPEPNKTLVKGKDLLEKIDVLMSARLIEGESEFSILCKPENLEFYIDEKQISQVLINLAKNGLQSVESIKGGKVQMVAGIDENDSKYIEIRDNGPGIPPEVMDEIFVPFFTTKSEGTGIGLSLSKRVMQLHGGSIQVRSVPHKETFFRLTFA